MREASFEIVGVGIATTGSEQRWKIALDMP